MFQNNLVTVAKRNGELNVLETISLIKQTITRMRTQTMALERGHEPICLTLLSKKIKLDVGTVGQGMNRSQVTPGWIKKMGISTLWH